jgi:hypothetical protein
MCLPVLDTQLTGFSFTAPLITRTGMTFQMVAHCTAEPMGKLVSIQVSRLRSRSLELGLGMHACTDVPGDAVAVTLKTMC